MVQAIAKSIPRAIGSLLVESCHRSYCDKKDVRLVLNLLTILLILERIEGQITVNDGEIAVPVQ